MPTELLYLTLTALMTALLFFPYVLNRSMVWGLSDTVGYPANPKPLSPWAERAKKAHYNAVENLVVFAAVVLVAHALNKSGGAIASAAMVYFWARLVHYLVYTFGIPWLRTLAFLVAWICCLVIIYQILWA
ncbi:MAG TPA: MAPEG family protein [bacterium]|nr:MAPEG family protein [bacterium]